MQKSNGYKTRQSQTVWNEIAYFLSRHQRHIDQHIFEEDPVARGGIVDQHMRNGPHHLSVLNDRRAAHECGQERTPIFHRNFMKLIILG